MSPDGRPVAFGGKAGATLEKIFYRRSEATVLHARAYMGVGSLRVGSLDRRGGSLDGAPVAAAWPPRPHAHPVSGATDRMGSGLIDPWDYRPAGPGTRLPFTNDATLPPRRMYVMRPPQVAALPIGLG